MGLNFTGRLKCGARLVSRLLPHVLSVAVCAESAALRRLALIEGVGEAERSKLAHLGMSGRRMEMLDNNDLRMRIWSAALSVFILVLTYSSSDPQPWSMSAVLLAVVAGFWLLSTRVLLEKRDLQDLCAEVLATEERDIDFDMDARSWRRGRFGWQTLAIALARPNAV